LKKGETSISLEWLTHLRLVKTYSEVSSSGKATWTLEGMVSEADEVRKHFATRAGYQTTDYADIGDNESDPFFLKMMNLGFVDHGASGFYDHHGRTLAGQYPH
jgi:hypothetical protein